MAKLRFFSDIIRPYESIVKIRRELRALKADILNFEAVDEARRYGGNQYKVYSTAVAEISKKYNAAADWGVLLTGNIIDLRAIFIISEGIQVVPRKGIAYQDAEKELTWANDFLEFNGLDKEAAQAYAREAEIEGKIALKLQPVTLKADEFKAYPKMVNVRYISWTDKRYKVKTANDDPMTYTELVWRPKNTQKDETIKAPGFVYKKFGGRVNNANEAQPKIMKCLTEVDYVSKALRDWREIDRLFSAPTPEIEVGTVSEAEKMDTVVGKINWKIKKIFTHTGKFRYVSPEMGGTASLDAEILRMLTMISGTTGVPLHWLGVTELLKQVATANDLREMANIATTPERMTWEGAYEETIVKAMKLSNKANQAGEGSQKLDPNKVRVKIPVISKEQWTRIEKVYLPLSVAGKISDELLLSNIPGVDLQEELQRAGDKQASDFERIKADNDRLSAELLERNQAAGNPEEEE